MRRFVFNVINNLYFISHKYLVITQESKQVKQKRFLVCLFYEVFSLFVLILDFLVLRTESKIQCSERLSKGLHKTDSLQCET